MAEQQPMFEALCYTNAEMRQSLAAVICDEGVVDVFSGDLLVTTGGSGLELDVPAGGAYVKGTNDAPDEGMYRFRNDAVVTVTATAADATNPRIDQVVVTIRNSEYGGLDNDAVISIVAGTPTAGATLTNLNGADNLSTYDNTLRLAYVLVPATFTGPFVDATHLKDARPQAGFCGGLVARVTGPSSQTDYTTSATAVTLNAYTATGRRYRLTGTVVGTQVTANGFPGASLKVDGTDFSPVAYLNPPGPQQFQYTTNSAVAAQGWTDFAGDNTVHAFTLVLVDSAGAFRVPANAGRLVLEDIGAA